MYREILSGFEPSNAQMPDFDFSPCLPNPMKPKIECYWKICKYLHDPQCISLQFIDSFSSACIMSDFPTFVRSGDICQILMVFHLKSTIFFAFSSDFSKYGALEVIIMHLCMPAILSIYTVISGNYWVYGSNRNASIIVIPHLNHYGQQSVVACSG